VCLGLRAGTKDDTKLYKSLREKGERKRRAGNKKAVEQGISKKKNSKSVAVAAIARDSSGCYLGASTLVFAGMSDPEILEVLACREDLALANDLLIQQARVASD